jgi:hypothetical protein
MSQNHTLNPCSKKTKRNDGLCRIPHVRKLVEAGLAELGVDGRRYVDVRGRLYYVTSEYKYERVDKTAPAPAPAPKRKSNDLTPRKASSVAKSSPKTKRSDSCNTCKWE